MIILNDAQTDEGANGELVPYGWAPGGYWCRSCGGCGEEYMGAKRCSRCHKCALALQLRDLSKQQKVMRGCETVRLGFSGDSGKTDQSLPPPAPPALN